jgi:hypothetical protein
VLKRKDKLQLSILGNAKTEIDIPFHAQVLEDDQEVQQGQFCFSIMNPVDGDKRIVWDSNDMTQIQEAKDLFDKLVEEGMIPYCVGVDGEKAEPMTTFNPFAEEILMGDKEVIFTPQKALAGG